MKNSKIEQTNTKQVKTLRWRENNQQNTLEIKNLPLKTSYKPGEEISYDGLQVFYNGQDVTKDCNLNPKAGDLFPAFVKTKQVQIQFKEKINTSFT